MLEPKESIIANNRNERQAYTAVFQFPKTSGHLLRHFQDIAITFLRPSEPLWDLSRTFLKTIRLFYKTFLGPFQDDSKDMFKRSVHAKIMINPCSKIVYTLRTRHTNMLKSNVNFQTYGFTLLPMVFNLELVRSIVLMVLLGRKARIVLSATICTPFVANI